MDPTRDEDIATNENEPDQGHETKEDPDTCLDMQNNEEVVTQQPKRSGNDATNDENDDKKSSLEKEGPSAAIELTPFSDEAGCVSASAGAGSVSKDYCDGLTNLECVGPNVSCVLFCHEFPTIVTDCTFELCSANFLIGAVLCTLGLALDTKLTLTNAGVVVEVLGTGLDTSEGFALGAFGSKIGLANKEKREKKWAKKKLKWEKKTKVAPEEEGVNGEVNAGADDANGDDEC